MKKEDILIELRIIRANIPLTGGEFSRKKIKELIERLENEKSN